MYLSSTIQSFCEKDDQSQTFCTWLRDTISTNIENVKKSAEEKTDHYSYQIRLFYHQLEGLERGFNKGVKRARTEWEIPSSDFLLLNSAADIRDLKVYYDQIVLKNDDRNMTIEQPKGTMVFRILEQEGLVKALFGHSSSGSYSAMLRMIKKYRFYYHFSSDPNSHLVPGINITFTGYPGIISSADDFYMITGKHSQLTVGGIGIWNENVDLWDNVDLDKSVLLSARLMAANRLAHGGRTWSKIMARDPSFGSKQWIVLDNKRLHHLTAEEFASFNTTSNKTVVKQGAPDNYNFNESPSEEEMINAHKGIIWVADQLPGRLHAEDMTGRIIKKGYWIGSGRPWFNEILDLSLIKDEEEIESMEEIESISEIDSVIKALKRRAFRGDLDSENEKAFGNIDAKAFSETNSGDVEFQALAGPLYHREIETPSALSLVSENYTEPEFHPRKISKKIDIFKWSKSNLNVKHDGHPDVWDFGKVTPKWAWST